MTVRPRSFTPEQRDALFAAILVNDRVDVHTALPGSVILDYGEQQLADGFGICRDLWQTGVRRDELLTLNAGLWRNRDLGPEDRLRFKHARARFKHLRFAFALYDRRHRYPTVLDWMTTAMGHMQDAFKNGRRGAVAREAALARLFLASGPQRLLERELGGFSPTSSTAFRRYVLRQMAMVRGILASATLTGAQFHATRKVISRQCSFYDNLRTIEPSEQAWLMSRSLAAINGLMGGMHDELIRQKIAGTRDYHREPFALPDEIRGRLEQLVARFPAA